VQAQLDRLTKDLNFVKDGMVSKPDGAIDSQVRKMQESMEILMNPKYYQKQLQ